jgi:hypothetical protein
MSITIAQICDAVASTLSAATTSPRTQSYDELTEGMQDTPTLQVYPEDGNQDPSGNTDRTSFKAGVRQTMLTVNADYYAHQRAHIGEDMAALVNGIDAITNILEAQDTKPYFGLAGIQAFSWSWRRVTFVYGDPQQSYVGARFTLNIRVF